MKRVAKVKFTGLMASKSVRRIFEVLQQGEKEPKVLFVGGCVRNALLDEKISDIDLATVWMPDDVIKLLKAAAIKVIPTGIDHGTVTAVLDGEHFQITTLRHDVETDGRHAKVGYTDDWAEDAKRRDFTFNTLLADIRGNIYDPLGVGLRDLEKRKVVFVGDPAIRIREDYLRILRFFRFHAWYGKGAPDKAGLKACAALSRNMKSLSKERVTEEVFKILLSPNAGNILSLMRDVKILPEILKSDFEENYFKFLKNFKEVDFSILGLLSVAGFSKSGTMRIVNALRLSNKQQKQLLETVSQLKKFKEISDHNLRVLLYRSGPEIAELVLVSKLILLGASKASSQKWVGVLRNMERPVMPLRGQDLLDRGMKPGPAIKKALDKFERSWIKSGFSNL